MVAGVDLAGLVGLPVDEAIDRLAQALTPLNGDGERIRAAMQAALAHALQDVEIFDQGALTEDTIRSTLIEYLALAIFNHIMAESGDAFDKPDDPQQAMIVQNDLQEFIRAVVEINAATVFPEEVGALLSLQDAERIEGMLVQTVLTEWEGYEK